MDTYPHKRILIIDDEKPILRLLCRSLSTIGFAVDIDLAETAEEEIKRIHKAPYDLILTDIKMAGMSGNDFFGYVKNEADQSIPIIAMSGTPWLLENSAFDAVIAKPFSKADLFGIMRQFISGPELK